MLKMRFAFPEVIEEVNPLLKLEELFHGIESKQQVLAPQDKMLLEDFLWVRNNVYTVGFAKLILLGDAYHYNNLIAQQPALGDSWGEMIEVLKSAMRHRDSENIQMDEVQFKTLEPQVVTQLWNYLSPRAKKVFAAGVGPIQEDGSQVVILYLSGLIAQLAIQVGLPFSSPCEIVKHYELNPFTSDIEMHLYFLSEHVCSLTPEVQEKLFCLNQSYRINTGYTYPDLPTSPVIAIVNLEGKLVNGTWYCKVLSVESDVPDTTQAIEEAKKIFEGDLVAQGGEDIGTTKQPIMWLPSVF